ncbi:MAG: hypothetical protein HQL32_17890 [Planctomycetes bacterium]|nr:hypothetical protein [Planctomycetota bacterium]
MDKAKTIRERLADQKFRAMLHFFILVLITISFFTYEYFLQPAVNYQALDKQQHYEAGHIISTLLFCGLYFLLSLKMLVSGQQAIIHRLIWLPTLYFIILGVVAIATGIVAAGKEIFDSTGMGNVEMADFTATLEGAYAPNIRVLALMLGFTPALIPLEMVLRSKASAVAIDHGKSDIKEYIQSSQGHKSKSAQVLLIEDDISCASLVMKFFKKIKLSVKHVESIDEECQKIAESSGQLKLMIVDMFIRVDKAGTPMTGGEWLKALHEKTGGQRDYTVIILTGHPEHVGELAQYADAVLSKPWSPAEMLTFLKERNILST